MSRRSPQLLSALAAGAVFASAGFSALAAAASLPVPAAWGLGALPLALAGAWLASRSFEQTSRAEIERAIAVRAAELESNHAQLLASQRVAATTTLAAGVAHEMNGPLTGILGLSQVLAERAREDGRERLAMLLGDVEREARRLHEIVKTLSGMADAQGSDGRIRVGLDVVLDDSVAMLDGRLRASKVDIARDYAPALQVLADPDRLRETFMHLLRNALSAVASVPSPRISLSAFPEESGRLIRVVISDNGPGIPADVLAKVFDPFFTTKATWTGKGLGLTVAMRTVQAHQGTIRLTSKVGEGTAVHVVLPAAPGAHLA